MQKHMWVAVAAAFGWAAWSIGSSGQWLFGALVGAAGIAFTWALSPWRGGRATHASVAALPQEQRPVVVYWRPGCVYCARLRGALARLRPQPHWVNIWKDAEAAAFVRSHNNGNETVPTVVIDGEVFVNPDPALAAARLQRHPGGGHDRP